MKPTLMQVLAISAVFVAIALVVLACLWPMVQGIKH